MYAEVADRSFHARARTGWVLLFSQVTASVGPPGLEPGTYGLKVGMSAALNAHAAQIARLDARNARNAQVVTGRCFHDAFHGGQLHPSHLLTECNCGAPIRTDLSLALRKVTFCRDQKGLTPSAVNRHDK